MWKWSAIILKILPILLHIDAATSHLSFSNFTYLDMVKYLQEDSGALPRAAFITVAGLGGVVAGYKGEMSNTCTRTG